MSTNKVPIKGVTALDVEGTDLEELEAYYTIPHVSHVAIRVHAFALKVHRDCNFGVQSG